MNHRSKVLRTHLDMAPHEVTVDSLVALATTHLGTPRTTAALHAIRRAPLTERRNELAGLAGLTVGTWILGTAWWSQPVPLSRHDQPPTGPTPDQVLAGAEHPHNLGTYGDLVWLNDAIAEATAEPAVDWVDLNFPITVGVVPVPEGLTAGDRFVCGYTTGGRVDVVVHESIDGLVTVIDTDSHRTSPPADVLWAVGGTLPLGRYLLPGEIADTSTDPYTAPLNLSGDDVTAVQQILTDAGHPTRLLTLGDLVDLLTAQSPPNLWHTFYGRQEPVPGEPAWAAAALHHLRTTLQQDHER